MQELISTAEASRVLGVTPSAISQMVTSQRLKPKLKMPGRTGAYLFDRAVIEAMVPQEAER